MTVDERETYKTRAWTNKAISLIAALRKLASSEEGNLASDADVLFHLATAEAADEAEALWDKAESLAGVRPASEATREMVRTLLENAVKRPDVTDIFGGF